MLRDLSILAGAKHIQWQWHMFEAIHFSLLPALLFTLMAAVMAFAEGAPAVAIRQIVLIGGTAVVGGSAPV